MINFSAIPQNSLLGKFLRKVLKLIPKNSTLPILQGKLRGRKWIIGSGVFGYWLGTYELEKQICFARTVEKGNVVYDIGANVGFYTLLASELVGSGGKVFAIEPSPRNIFYLKKHVEMNKCPNVKIIEAAASDKAGTMNFDPSENFFTGKVSNDGPGPKIKTIAIDNLVYGEKFSPPDVLKIDVEGAELMVLRGAVKVLEDHHPKILLATHSRELRKDCLAFLANLNYRFVPINKTSIEDDFEIFACVKQ